MSEELKSFPTQPAAASPAETAFADLESLRAEQNITLAWLAGAGAAVIGASVWAAITILTEYQIGWMAVGVGALVGISVRHLGKGVDTAYGLIGAGWSLFGCALGNLLTVCIVVSQVEGVPLIELLSQLTFGTAAELMSLTFSPIDLLFYGLALHAGYKLSLRELPAGGLAEGS